MAVSQPRYVTEEKPAPLAFSICTLVASEERYRRMLASFERLGFNESNAEFIALDNRDYNRFDGYRALRSVFPECRGEFILFTHDDIELVDEGAEHLLAVLRDLEQRDPSWAVAGNAGYASDSGERLVLHLSDPHGATRGAPAPVEVQSLDENFLVLRRSRMVFPSLDLEGFHIFAVDLCLQARMAGGRAYVVPFFLRHHSGGKGGAAYERARAQFTRKYASLRIPARVRSPAATLYIGSRGQCLRLIDHTVDFVGSRLRRGAARVAGRFEISGPRGQ